MRPAPEHVREAADAVMVALGWPEDRRTLVVEVVKALDDRHMLTGAPTAPEPTLSDVAEAAQFLATYSPRYEGPFGWQAIVRQSGNLHHAYMTASKAAMTPQEVARIGRAYDVVNQAQRRGTARRTD